MTYTKVDTASVSKAMLHYLRVFENRILRRIFGHKRDENGRVEKATQ
jgi:hypothetical protein